MRAVVDISMTLLIAGICSLSVTQALGPNAGKLSGFHNSFGELKFGGNSMVLPAAEAGQAGGSRMQGEPVSEGVWKQKCGMNGGPRAFDTYEEVQRVMLNCTRFLVNPKQLIGETLRAREKGELVPLFKEYCRRAPIIHKLEDYLMGSIRACLYPEEHPTLDTFQNLGQSMLNYICHDEGYRPATFAEAGGVNCLAAKQRTFGKCYGQYIARYVAAFHKAGLDKYETLPVLGNEFRADMERFRACTVKMFNECGDRTSTDLWNSMIIHLSNKIPFY